MLYLDMERRLDNDLSLDLLLLIPLACKALGCEFTTEKATSCTVGEILKVNCGVSPPKTYSNMLQPSAKQGPGLLEGRSKDIPQESGSSCASLTQIFP